MNLLASDLKQQGTRPPPGAADSLFHDSLLDRLSFAVLRLSTNGIILDCNQAACSLANTTRSELLGGNFSSVFDFSGHDSTAQIDEAILHAANTGLTGIDLSIRDVSNSGEKLVFRFTFRSLSPESDEPASILVEGRDVTSEAARNVEAAKLIEGAEHAHDNAAEERLRLAQSAAQIGVWEWDPVHDIHLLSPELHRIFGTDPLDAELPAKWTAHVLPSDWNRVQMLMIEGHRLGSMEFEYRYNHPDLGVRWLFCKGHRRPSETRMFGIVQDVTLRKNAEMAAEQLAAIVASSDDAIVSKDLDGIVTSWNPGAERIFGYSAAEMIGQPISKIIPPELYDDETRILSTISRGDRIEHFETVRLRKTGEKIEVSLTVSPVKDQAGKIIGAAKIARDITQQRKAERALRTTERLASVGRLAATVAHEINNPLEAVTNLIFLASHSEDAKPYLKMAEEELERVSLLTRQTLGFYRETKIVANVRLGELVSSLLSVFTPRMRNKNVRFTSEINEVEIEAVPGEIRQVIANLISNSIDALGAGGDLRIRVRASAQHKEESIKGIRLTIADNGSGIPREIRAHLFEPFFTTKKEVGTGLGLWICKSIIEKHTGVIKLRSSTAPGSSYTVFSIFLPAKAPHSCAAPVPDEL